MKSYITWAWFPNILIYSRSKAKLIFDENYCHFVYINIIRVEVSFSFFTSKKGRKISFPSFRICRFDLNIVKLLRMFFIHSKHEHLTIYGFSVSVFCLRPEKIFILKEWKRSRKVKYSKSTPPYIQLQYRIL